MQVQWDSEHSSKITQHHTVKVYSDWELQSTVGVQTVLSAKWAATPGALLVYRHGDQGVVDSVDSGHGHFAWPKIAQKLR